MSYCCRCSAAMANVTLFDGSLLDRVDLLMLALDFDLLVRLLVDNSQVDYSSVAVSIRWQLSTKNDETKLLPFFIFRILK